MISKKSKRRLTIVTASGICAFTLVTTFTSTLAWFAFNKTSQVSGMSIQVKLINSDVNSVTVHRCKLAESTKDLLKFDSVPSVSISGHGVIETEVSGIEMANYSILNQTQPVLLLFTFEDGMIDSDIDITATSDNNTYYDHATVENIGNFPFSSAVKFFSKSYTTQSFPFDNIPVNSLGSEQKFITTGEDQGGDPIITGFTQSLHLYTGNTNNNITYLALILDYCADAVDCIVRKTSVEAFSSHSNYVSFVCDWALAL